MQPVDFVWKKYYTRVSDRSLYFSRIWTSIDVIAEIINELWLVSEAATKINSSLSDAEAAELFDYADLLVSQACKIWDSSNLSATKLSNILDHPNLTPARIKSIFEAGYLLLGDRISLVLDADQFAAADAASSVNGTYYSVAQLASAFGHTNLAIAKAAAILDHTNLSISKAASVTKHADCSASRVKSFFLDAALTEARRVPIAHGWSQGGGKTPTLSGTWENNPTNLTNMTDNSPSTTIGAGNVKGDNNTTMTGYINIDLGSILNVKVLTVKFAATYTYSYDYGIGTVALQYSANGTDWTDICSFDKDATPVSVDTTYLINANIRYVRFKLSAYAGASQWTKYTIDSCHFCLC